MPLLHRCRTLAAKAESEKGSRETSLGDTYAKLLVADLRFPYSPEPQAREVMRANLSPWPTRAGPRIANLTCRTEARGSGIANVAPSWGLLLEASGFVDSVGSTSVVYSPDTDDTDFPTLTMQCNLGSSTSTRRREGYGMRGTWTLNATAGGICYFDWTFQGIYYDDTDQTQYTPTYETTVPPQYINSQLSIGSFTTAKYGSLTLAWNATLVVRPNANATLGLDYTMITERNPTLTIDPDAELVATKDWSAMINASTLEALAFTIGNTAGNIIEFAAPKMLVQGMDDTDRESIATDTLTCLLCGDTAGDDELVITTK